MSGVLQVSEATHREDFVKTPNQSGVTWTFAADDDLNGPSPCRPNLKSPTYNWLSNSRSQESEDSGVKSSSQNEDEPPISPTSTSSDDVKKKRSILRKMSNISGVSLRSSPSTPLFDFPTFDELFETEGKQHMKLSMHQSKSGFLRQQSYPGPAVSVLDENADDMEASLTQAEESRRSFKRQDSVLSQNFSSMVYRSWKGSKGFRGYRERLGTSIHHRYCMCCRFESTVFIGLYLLVGIFLSCSGVVCYINCSDEILVSYFLIADGVFSVFVFPILVMVWTKRVGGCVGQEEKVESGSFWISLLVFRILLTASGTFVCVYRYHLSDTDWSEKICRYEFYALLAGVVFEWTFCVVVIFLPLCVYFILYLIAPTFEPKSDLNVIT